MTTDSTPATADPSTTQPQSIERRWGAVAIIDALGFKRIWKREGVDPRSVATNMQNMRNELMAMKEHRAEVLNAHSGEMRVSRRASEAPEHGGYARRKVDAEMIARQCLGLGWAPSVGLDRRELAKT